MRRFYTFVVRNPKKILALFILLMVFAALCWTGVGVNYNVTDYLPPDTPSTEALEVLGEEFSGGIPNARVMIRGVSLPEALRLKEELAAAPGVESVTWLDDAVNVLEPLEFQDKATVETYYRDSAALYTLTISDAQRIEAVAAVRGIAGENGAVTGDAVSTSDATTGTVAEVRLITVIAVIFVWFILTLTTTSWAEPVIVLAGLGVATVLNAGSNIIFGEISFVTNAAGSVLQLACTLDYSVFLIHRFSECLEEKGSAREAMIDALCKSTTSIMSSGLTTVIGFLALVFMRFGLGPDLGTALAKGIAISMITVFIFEPALILTTHKLMLRTSHRPFLPKFDRFGSFVSRVMLPMLLVFAIIMVPSLLASMRNDYYYGAAHIYAEGTQYGEDTAAIEAVFGKSDTYVAMVPAGDLAREQQLSEALHEIPEVESVLSYVDTVGAEIPMEYLDEDTLSLLVSDNYSRFVITVRADSEGETAFALVERVRGVLNEAYPGEYYLAGDGVSTYDLMDTITADNLKVNLIAVAAVFIVLLLSFKSLSLPVILVLSIETAIWINMAIPYFRGSTVFYISYLIVSSIQLGATVDYAILFADRYLEFRQSLPRREAVIRTVSAITVSVSTSGSAIIVVGLGLGFVSKHQIISQLGFFLGIGGALSLAIVLFVLPGFMYLCDGIVCRTTLHANFLTSKEVKSHE